MRHRFLKANQSVRDTLAPTARSPQVNQANKYKSQLLKRIVWKKFINIDTWAATESPTEDLYFFFS